MPHITGAIACTFMLSACAPIPVTDVEGSLVVVGSSSQQKLIGAWESVWRRDRNTVSVNFSPDGENVGVSSLLDGLSHVATADGPLTDDLVADSSACGGSGAFSVPTAIFPVSVVFNLAAIRDVRLDGSTLAKIFNGEISTWDDAQIKALNPTISFPAVKIHVVTSGESALANMAGSEYLHNADALEWPSEPSVQWPASVKGKIVPKTSDIAQEVDNNLGSIAFLDTASIGNRFNTVALKFGSSYVRPTEEAYDRAAQESEYTTSKGGVLLSFSKKDGTGYGLAAVGYQVFCYQYSNEPTVRLVSSWADSVLGDLGQDTSSRIGGVASPKEEARAASLRYFQLISSAEDPQ